MKIGNVDAFKKSVVKRNFNISPVLESLSMTFHLMKRDDCII